MIGTSFAHYKITERIGAGGQLLPWAAGGVG
jgi:hypothetical protein